MRKGKERRKNFAQSMQALSQSTMQALNITRDSVDSDAPNSVQPSHDMRPPERPTSSPLKRKSLPNGFNDEDSPHKSHKKHRESDHEPSTESLNVSQQRPIKRHHKRSSTMDSTSQASSSSVNSQPHFNPMSSFAGNASLLSDSVMRKARQLIPVGPTDTTRTDYFRLKAMGIDPNTQAAPARRKRRISDHEDVNPKRASLLSPAKPTPSTLRPPPPTIPTPPPPPLTHNPNPTTVEDSDDELFAQVRHLKAAMSDSMAWYRDERHKSEQRSRSNSSVVAHEQQQQPPHAETPAERRLRELKRTPSRTEIRLRETGARGLLPKDWAARSTVNGVSASGGAVREEERTPTRGKMGFAAMGGRGEDVEREEIKRRQDVGVGTGTGASVDDAIEL